MAITGMKFAHAKWCLAGIIGAVMGCATASWHQGSSESAEPKTGYCEVQHRYLEDREFIDSAVVLYEWDQNTPVSHFPSGAVRKKKDDHLQLYESWERSKTRPDCCSVHRHTSEITAEDPEVEVSLGLDPSHREDSQLKFAFNRCGKLLPHPYGYHFPSRIEVTTKNVSDLTR